MQHQPQLLDDLRAAEVPVVALWQGSELHDISAVNVDNAKGVTAAVRHLQDLGHARIAFISSQLLGDIRERQAAYVDAVGPVPEGYLQHVANSPAGGADALLAMLRLPEPPTAVIASTDVVAMGALHAAAEQGLTVPDDLSVVGFDDIPLARFCVPALTTVRMPTTEMVAAAAGLVVEALDRGRGEQSTPVVRLFDPEIVVRASSGPPPAAR